jgi:hypothetical protein
MALANNPLRQYFRRPAIYLSLPSKGIGYEPGILNLSGTGELPVYPMTAIDEITSRTPDALFNGSAVVEVIKSCIPDIIEPWKILSTDLDAVLLAIRSASQGNEMELDTQCPSCEEIGKYGVNLVGILSSLKAPDYSNELKIGDLGIKFRPLVYAEMNIAATKQFELQKFFSTVNSIEDENERNKKFQEGITAITKVTMGVLSETIEYISTPGGNVEEKAFILDFLENCDKDAYAKIRDYNTDLKSSSEMKPLKIKCVHCQHDYEQNFTINASDFFG